MKSVLLSFLLLLIMISACNSPKKIFETEVQELIPTSKAETEYITEEKISLLPEPVQRYLKYSGFLGQPVVGVSEIIWDETKIKLGPEKSWTNLETRQFNFVSTGSRLAYMNARMALVIPFEGRDRYHKGQGHMLGTLARTITVFDNESREVTLGGAVIVLAESLLEPSIALQEYIIWESVDALTTKATFRDGNIEVSGNFRFNEIGEFIRFESNDRPYEISGGSYKLKPFSIDLGEYHETGGLKIAGRVFATWHLDKGDFTYWDGKISGLKRGVTASE